MAAYYWSLILLPVCFGCVLTLSQQEINALEELQTKWNIPDWQGEPNCTTWSRHLTCNGHLNVISLDIGFAKPELLSGTIPEEICNLTYLEELKLYGNRLSGAIPNCIGGLVHLSYLDLSGNCLGGEIPESLGNLTRMEYFDLSFNYHNEFSFSHRELCRKSILATGLTGAIPASVGRMTKVKSFYLSGNRLTEEIPESLGNLTNAMYIYINANNLTGSLPKTMGNLQNLQDLQLNNNNLTGAIPKEIGNCVSIRTIQMSRNHITGEIPNTIGNLAQLQVLELLENNLEGRIPEFKTTPVLNLNLFDVRHNNLSGALPESFGDAPLRYLFLSNNPYLRGHGNKLPDYIRPNFATKSTVDDVRSFDCPGFVLLSRVFQITAPLIQLDPEYYNYSLCDCKSGYFGSPPDKCRQCLPHGSCLGNSAMQFWRFYPITDDTGDVQGLIECTDDLACNGHCFYGKNGLSSDNYGNCSLCAPNYYGRLCSKCACSSQACFYHGHNECKPCKKIKSNTVVLYSIALIVTLSLFAVFHNSSLVRLLFIIVLVSLVLTSESGSWLYLNILVVMIILIPATSNGLSSGLVKSLIFYLQTTPVLIPPLLNRTLSSTLSGLSFSVFRFSDVKLIGLVCLFPNILGFSANATLHRYIFSLCAPIIVFLLVLVFLVFKNVILFALRRAGFRLPSSATTRAQVLFSLVFIAYFSFFNASALVISVFFCSKDASGHSYMTAQHYRSVQCYTGSEWHNMVKAAIIGAIFLVFLPLIIFTAVLHKHKSSLDDPELMSWLGYLYVSYRPRDSTTASKLRNRSWFYFEIVYMIFRFLLAVSVSVPRQGKKILWAPSVTAMLLIALAAILLTLKPYARKVDNKAAFISTMTLIIEVLSSVPCDNQDAGNFVIYTALNVLTIFMFLVLIIWYGRDELKRNVYNVKVLLLYLCNRLRECRRPNTEDQEPCLENFEQ